MPKMGYKADLGLDADCPGTLADAGRIVHYLHSIHHTKLNEEFIVCTSAVWKVTSGHFTRLSSQHEATQGGIPDTYYTGPDTYTGAMPYQLRYQALQRTASP